MYATNLITNLCINLPKHVENDNAFHIYNCFLLCFKTSRKLMEECSTYEVKNALICGILVWYVYHVDLYEAKRTSVLLRVHYIYAFVKRMKINEHIPTQQHKYTREITMYLNSSASLKHFGLA